MKTVTGKQAAPPFAFVFFVAFAVKVASGKKKRLPILGSRFDE